CALLITGILYALDFLFPSLLSLSTPILLVISVTCFTLIYTFYYFIVGRKLKRITDILAGESKFDNPSLTDLEEGIKRLLRERKEELEKIEKLERHRKEFLGNVSHEMKTPIFHIQGYISTLLENNIDDPEMEKRYLERTEKSAERLIHILEDLDTISQLESKEVGADIEPFDIVQLCEEVLESEAIDAEEKEIKLVLENSLEKAGVIGDRFRIKQVLVNLVVNSIKYGKKGGQTTIRVKNEPDTLFIEVTDNGIGIASQHLSRLFERFYRVDKGR